MSIKGFYSKDGKVSGLANWQSMSSQMPQLNSNRANPVYPVFSWNNNLKNDSRPI